jgi:ribonuclease HI
MPQPWIDNTGVDREWVDNTEEVKMYQLFTDGACKANGSPNSRGGWAYLLTRIDLPDFRVTEAGSESHTTNNRMELQAIIQGLKLLSSGAKVEIVTDSTYAITVAYSKNSKLKNSDLIHEYRQLLSGLDFTFTHVRGHSGHPENELVDTLASGAAQGKIG